MRQIKFRGKREDDDRYIYGDLIEDSQGLLIYNNLYNEYARRIKPASVGQYIDDCKSGELYEGDEIRIDYDAAAKVIGDGLLLRTIQTLKPSNDAKLKIEYSHYRYRLIWKTHNGRVDTGIDMALLETILPFVEVVSDDAN